MYSRVSEIALFICMLLLSACATVQPNKPNPLNPIRTIALMPMTNNTNDVDGPFVVRALLATELEDYFYTAKSLEETDLILKDQVGVTLGSQLDMATTAQLCEKINADAILFGSLEDFSQKTTGIYNNKRVRFRVKLDNCKTGKTVWKNGIGVKRESLAGDSGVSKAPGLGSAVTAVAVAASVFSGLSDKADVNLPEFRSEEIKTPWQDISEDNSSSGLNRFVGSKSKFAKNVKISPLIPEAETAVKILLHGDYDDGSDIIPYGTMIPLGPVTPATPVVK